MSTIHEIEQSILQYLTTQGYGFQPRYDGTILVQSPYGIVLVNCKQIHNSLAESDSGHSVESLVDAQLHDTTIPGALTANVDVVVDGDTICTNEQIIGPNSRASCEPSPTLRADPLPPWWSIDYITKDGFLIESWSKHVRDDKALYFGRYALSSFSTLAEFNYFAAKFGCCAQHWYATRDVAQLSSDMHPWPSSTFPENYAPEIATNQRLHDILRKHKSSFLTSFVGDFTVLEFIVTGFNIDGEYLFGMVGRTDTSWVDIFYLYDMA